MSGVTKDDLKAFYEEAQGVERDLLDEYSKRARRGWIFGWSQFGLAVLAVGCAYIALNRPVPDPVVLRVDNTTGIVERVTTLAEDQVTTSEADDVFWINRFVLSREAYDYNTIQRTHDTTMLLSTAEVGKAYNAIFTGPTARDAVWQDKVELNVEIRSITPDLIKRTALVRFTTQKRSTTRGTNPEPPQYWIANLRYTYVVNAEMSDSDRRENPKAFQVLSYRVDPEIFSAK